MSVSLPLAFFAAKSATDRLVSGMFDDSFAGIHHLGFFDWAMLIPYFTVLVILSVYGLHRYDVIRTYFKHRRKATGEPPLRFEQLPPVTIQLPLYNERYVVERLIEEVLKIEYPKELLQIQVLDDSTDDTAPFAEALVERYRTIGYPIEYHHRSNRHGYKAGALQEGLETATGELVAIFDADFCPPADFLTRTCTTSPTRRSAWCRRAGAISIATITSSPKWKRCCWTDTLSWSTGHARGRDTSSISTVRREFSAGR